MNLESSMKLSWTNVTSMYMVVYPCMGQKVFDLICYLHTSLVHPLMDPDSFESLEIVDGYRRSQN